MRCLVIGATGYVGSCLVPRLLDGGHVVRCLVRDEAKLHRQPWADQVEAVRGDMADPSSVSRACADVDAVFYLVHAMDGPGFVERDRSAAATLAAAAAGVRRVVYLGGLQPEGERNSTHLASRREVGDILLAGAAPTAVLQAGIVIGAGSASFVMVLQLAESGPVLALPDRAWNRTQPIGIDDVLHYLVACLDLPPEVNATFDIGGPDVLTFGELVTGCAVAAGLPHPVLVPLPVSAPRLTARALAAVLPVDRHLAGPLLESMAYDLVCRGEPPAGPPPGGLTPYAEAARRALAGRESPRLIGEHVESVAAPAAVLWEVISGLGGDTGWYTIPGVWALRGGLDRLVGGVGARRTRPDKLEPGAALDWWRIEEVEEGTRLLLRAETKMPGTTRLELRAEPDGPERSRYVQRVEFTPDGLPGRVYWYGQLPAHNLVFGVMARTVAGVAAQRARVAG
ncbi:MAG TPA: SDR family oxidoreductase [Pseudonocardia sp.]